MLLFRGGGLAADSGGDVRLFEPLLEAALHLFRGALALHPQSLRAMVAFAQGDDIRAHLAENCRVDAIFTGLAVEPPQGCGIARGEPGRDSVRERTLDKFF